MSPEVIGTIIGLLIFAIPFWKILDRTGLSKAWVLALLLPGLGVFILWLVIARSQWRMTPEGEANGS
jgi:hypothetical protein